MKDSFVSPLILIVVLLAGVAVLREARRASQINDRRIAAIYDVLELDDDVQQASVDVRQKAR